MNKKKTPPLEYNPGYAPVLGKKVGKTFVFWNSNLSHTYNNITTTHCVCMCVCFFLLYYNILLSGGHRMRRSDVEDIKCSVTAILSKTYCTNLDSWNSYHNSTHIQELFKRDASIRTGPIFSSTRPMVHIIKVHKIHIQL